jgi:hypothetical protein
MIPDLAGTKKELEVSRALFLGLFFLFSKQGILAAIL